MSLLTKASYSPSTQVQKATSSLLAMTALDTTNLRASFTPPNNFVQVKLRGVVYGATTFPRIFLGILSGATVVLRKQAIGTRASSTATVYVAQEVTAVVPVTAGSPLVWDAAYGVETVVASTNLAYGGPNDANGNDNVGAFQFQVFDAVNCLGALIYDPSTAATIGLAAGVTALAAMDTTNLRKTITVPASGNIFWRLVTQIHGTTTPGQLIFGIFESGSLIGDAVTPIMGNADTFAASSCLPLDASGVITGLTPGSHTLDAAFGIQTVGGAGEAIKQGGPNDTTSNNAFGATTLEFWGV